MNRRHAIKTFGFGALVAASARLTSATISKRKSKPADEMLVANAATLVRLAELQLLCSYQNSRILRGCVVWCSTPPVGSSAIEKIEHKYTLLESVDTGLRFCGEARKDECWIVAGFNALTHFARVWQLRFNEGKAFCGFIPKGHVRDAVLIECLGLDPDRFYVGNHDTLCLGRVTKSEDAHSFVHPGEAEQDRRAMHGA